MKIWIGRLTIAIAMISFICIHSDASDKHDATTHRDLGFRYFLKMQWDEAIRDYQLALQINPALPDVHYHLGLAYAQQGRVDDAIKEMEITLKLKPDHSEAKRLLHQWRLRKPKAVDIEVGGLISQLMLGLHSNDENLAKAIHDRLISIGPPAVKHLTDVKLICSILKRTFELDIEEFKRNLLKELHEQLPEDMRWEDVCCEVEGTDDEDAVNAIIHIPKQASDPKDRREYLKKAERLLNEIELFDPPERLSETESQVIYSMKLNLSGLQDHSIEVVLALLHKPYFEDPERDKRWSSSSPARPAKMDLSLARATLPLDNSMFSEQWKSRPLVCTEWRSAYQARMIIQRPYTGSLGGVVKWYEEAELRLVKDHAKEGRALPADISEGTEIKSGTDLSDGWYILGKAVLLDSRHIIGARAVQEQDRWVVVVHLNSLGRRKLARITSDHVGQRLAVVFCDEVQCAPEILTEISGDVQIEGNFTAEGAAYLASILKYRHLPDGMRISSAVERIIDPILGPEARSLVVSALGKIGDAQALPVLELLVKNDDDVNVRNKAAEAIRMIEAKNVQ